MIAVLSPLRAPDAALLLACAIALGACASGKPAPDDTPMAQITDPTQLTYLFGMGDKACTIGAVGANQDLGSPEAMVKVPPFAIDVHEVTVEQYRYCVEMEHCSEPAAYNGPNNVADYYLTATLEANPKFNSFPVVYVTWRQAQEYCEYRGKRLPTEFEWELVAGGAAKTREEKLLYTFLPNQKGPDVKLPGDCEKGVALAACQGGSPDAKSVMASADDYVTLGGVKVFDLAGNVMEWTSSDADELGNGGTHISATCDWNGTEEPWTCGDCVDCLAKAGTAGATKCGMCHTCVCGNNQELPADPTATTIRPECYQPNKTPICPRQPPGKVLEKAYTTKNISSKRVVRGGAFVTANLSGLAKTMIDNCFGRSDARVLAKGPQDDPLQFVGFRCAKDVSK